MCLHCALGALGRGGGPGRAENAETDRGTPGATRRTKGVSARPGVLRLAVVKTCHLSCSCCHVAGRGRTGAGSPAERFQHRAGRIPSDVAVQWCFGRGRATNRKGTTCRVHLPPQRRRRTPDRPSVDPPAIPYPAVRRLLPPGVPYAASSRRADDYTQGDAWHAPVQPR